MLYISENTVMIIIIYNKAMNSAIKQKIIVILINCWHLWTPSVGKTLFVVRLRKGRKCYLNKAMSWAASSIKISKQWYHFLTLINALVYWNTIFYTLRKREPVTYYKALNSDNKLNIFECSLITTSTSFVDTNERLNLL